MKTSIVILFILTLSVCYGQNIKVDTLKSIEQNERTLMALADTAFHRGWNIDYNDSLTYEDVFIKNLLLVIKSPKSFKYKFPLLTNQHSDFNAWRIIIIYSDDSLFRVFNWLSPMTGTLNHYPAIFQAQNKNRKIIYSYPEATYSEGSLAMTRYVAIYRLTSTPKQLYLSIGFGQGSSSLPFEMINTYEVTNDSINSSDILPDSTKMTSSILIDRQATMYDNNSEDIPTAEYDKKRKCLTIPEIDGSYYLPQNVKWTGKLIRLKFNGQKFERQK